MINYKNLKSKDYKGYIVYKLTNPKGGVYIGITHSLKQRLETYTKRLKAIQNQVNLYKSILKYGIENHKVEIVSIHPSKNPLNLNEAQIIEQSYIVKEYLTNKDNLLNIIVGGVERKWRETNPIKI